MTRESLTTTDHETIKQWAEERGGRPVSVEGTEAVGEEAGVLRIDFPDSDDSEENFREISWEEFFEKFEKEKLAFLYQEKTHDGEVSRFNKLVSR